jgi:asparagine synthase (glutamine-hydrolysing)
MCGIAGIVNLDGKPLDTNALRNMCDQIIHRGPDDEGYVLFGGNSEPFVRCGGKDTVAELALPDISSIQAAYSAGFGFRRLSIIDLSAQGHQPMISRDGRYLIVFNGEVYNYLEIRQELEALDCQFSSQSDTEVVLQSFITWGPACVSRFNGMWGLCIYDNQEQTLFASRDRVGVKPFYYHFDGARFIFGSEIKQILVDPSISSEVDDAVAVNFLRDGMKDYSSDTFFKHIKQLEPAHNLFLRNGLLEMKRYWNFDINENFENAPLTAHQKSTFFDLFKSAVELRHRADVPVGIALSGGLDSSSTSVMANEVLHARFKTFTMVFDEQEYDERDYARAVTKVVNCDHFEFHPASEDVLQELDDLVYQLEEPFRSLSSYSQWCLMRLAKQNGVTVLLEGQGADELLGGYLWYYDSYFLDHLRNRRFHSFIRDLQQYSNNYGLTFFSGMKRALINYSKYLLADLKPAFLTGRGTDGLFSPETRRLFYVFPQRYKSALANTLDFGLQKLIRELLNYGDKDSMRFSMEARVPFMDFRLIEFVTSLPLSAKMSGSDTKKILRESLSGLLPSEIRFRRGKLGFATPQEHWQRRQFKDLMVSTLGSGELNNGRYLDTSRYQRYVDDYFNGRHDDYGFIWRCFSYERWRLAYRIESV